MKKEISEETALQRLAAECAAAEHCSHDMLERMKRWELPEEARRRVLDKLVSGRYVDDQRYARAFVREKLRYNKWGQRKIEQALWQKHIDEDTRQQALSDITPEEYAEVLRPLLKQKRRSTTASSDYELRQKLLRFAIGRGFTLDVISLCLEIPTD